jgi:bifunctional non-homologous end joining protein LigD
VLKRLDSAYAEGRRSKLWIKHKVRRREVLTVTAWSPARGRSPEAFHLSRPSKVEPDTLEYAGAVSLGLAYEEREQLRTALHAARRDHGPRRRVVPVQPLVRLVVESHGRIDGPLRDPIIREVKL